jgi:hypothetical protein
LLIAGRNELLMEAAARTRSCRNVWCEFRLGNERIGVKRLDPAAINGHDQGGRNGALVMDPVFVLRMGRSGSTLLRLILDAG